MLAVLMTGARMSVISAHAEVQIHASAGDGRYACTAFCPQGHFVQSLCVNPGGTDGCESSISAAVAEISQNDVIITIAPGTYVDNVSINTGANPIPVDLRRKPLKLTIASSSTAAATIINGNGAGPVFTIGPKAKVELDGLTITNGVGGPVQEETGGGGILANGASLQIHSCVISDNQGDVGAGIYANNTDLNVVNSTVSGNVGIEDSSSGGGRGGGIDFESAKGTLTISRSIIDGNSATYSGGGIEVFGGYPPRVTVAITNSTISNNVAGCCGGGGLYLFAAILTMTNSTMSGNQTGGNGGAIQTTLADVNINNATIANNYAGPIGGGIYAGGTVAVLRKKILLTLNNFVIANAIIADNQAAESPDCQSGVPQLPIISKNYNFIGDPSGCAMSGQTANNLAGDPLLGPLQNNGGPTDTQALLPGSLALGAGNPAKPEGRNGHCLATDQIGTARPMGACDIGAYQVP
jgi:hypothetical protein